MVRTCLTLVALGLASTAYAQDWAKARLEQSPRHLEWVTVTHGDRKVECFTAYPEVPDKAPAVVVIHEIFGLTDWIRSVCDQLAEAGYIAIAPDLLSSMGKDGGGTASFGGGDDVRTAIRALPADQVTADLGAVVDHAIGLPACNGKVTVAGFCWGGAQAFRFATNSPKIAAAFVFYGAGPESADDIARIQAPVYGFYGGNDARVNTTIPTSTQLMAAAGRTYVPVTYGGAGHGFMRAGEAPDASPENKKAREEAWARWRDLLEKL